ncbi:MAG TPA: diphthine--ammonia ligase [Nitrososphaera sp.]|nr:diphthine--ammonia ligase [Nitrososphaera sp.]
MRLACLFSGGKDSTYSILRAKEMGHETACLITLHPAADDSLVFHYPNSQLTKHLAESMQIPLIESNIQGRSKEDESRALENAVVRAKALYSINSVLNGGISSRFQKQVFDKVCLDNKLTPVAPMWGADPVAYMHELVDRGFQIMIVAVSAMGLGKEWLGAILDRHSLETLYALSKKYGFNVNFEGGEAETLVIDCPLYHKRLQVNQADIQWDGQRGMFEIRDAALVEK